MDHLISRPPCRISYPPLCSFCKGRSVLLIGNVTHKHHFPYHFSSVWTLVYAILSSHGSNRCPSVSYHLPLKRRIIQCELSSCLSEGLLYVLLLGMGEWVNFSLDSRPFRFEIRCSWSQASRTSSF